MTWMNVNENYSRRNENNKPGKKARQRSKSIIVNPRRTIKTKMPTKITKIAKLFQINLLSSLLKVSSRGDE